MCRVNFNRKAEQKILLWHPTKNEELGNLVESKYVELRGSVHIYHDTFEQDDGGQYTVRVVSQWSPSQLNKLREDGVQILGFPVAGKNSSLSYDRKGPSLK